tara:strand:+ start:345 stop:461 length:117 start_codon:yes stop_codon:yes gene_type:complete
MCNRVALDLIIKVRAIDESMNWMKLSKEELLERKPLMV